MDKSWVNICISVDEFACIYHLQSLNWRCWKALGHCRLYSVIHFKKKDSETVVYIWWMICGHCCCLEEELSQLMLTWAYIPGKSLMLHDDDMEVNKQIHILIRVSGFFSARKSHHSETCAFLFYLNMCFNVLVELTMKHLKWPLRHPTVYLYWIWL